VIPVKVYYRIPPPVPVKVYPRASAPAQPASNVPGPRGPGAVPMLCIAHKKPLIPSHLYDAIIDTPSRENYEALVSVVAQPVMARLAPDGPVGICGYRKVLIHGETSHAMWTIAQGAKITWEQTQPRPGHEFLVCMHNFADIGHIHKNVKEQWYFAHRGIDLSDGLNLAREMGIMTEADCRALELEPELVEGGFSMGVFPGKLMRESLTKLIPFYDEFARRYRDRFLKYNPMQRRCVAFLAERMESHFILKELRRRYPSGLPAAIKGCLIGVSDGPWIAGTMP